MEDTHQQFKGASDALYRRIVASTTKQQLSAVKTDLIAWNKTVETDLPTFLKKRAVDVVASLFQYVEVKENQLAMTKFRFVGPPVVGTVGQQRQHQIASRANTRGTPNDNAQAESGVKVVGLSHTTHTISSSSHVLIMDTDLSQVVSNPSAVPLSIHIKNGSNSTFTVTAAGPVFVHGLRHCTLVLNCHQVRLHDLRDCTVVIDKVENNRIILEDCVDLAISGVDGLQIDDFNWPRNTPNPHYRLLATVPAANA